MYRFACSNGPDVDELRERLRGMSDQELLRFGTAAKVECSNNSDPPREVLLQLEEARVEWKRRMPDLPLNSSV